MASASRQLLLASSSTCAPAVLKRMVLQCAVRWAAHLLTDRQVGKATPFSICLPLKMLAHSLCNNVCAVCVI